ncbi:MAG: GvpL/GvpF family gas vesicle protein [Bacteroidota bacterium]
MQKKLYLYGVVRADQNRSLGALGLSTEGSPSEIRLHSIGGLGVAYQEKEIHDDEELPASRKNLVNHQRIVELMMGEYAVLPFAFGTLVNDTAALETLVNEKKEELEATLDKIEGMVELSLKVLWEKMDTVFEELMTENDEINEKRQYLIENNIHNQDEKIELGKMVEAALDEKKEAMLEVVLSKLSTYSKDQKVLKNVSDAMFANVAFFVERSKEKDFDAAVNELSDRMGENLVFKYVGPMAPVNFI